MLRAILDIVDEVLPIEKRDAMRVGEIVQSPPLLSARDAVHVAVMERPRCASPIFDGHATAASDSIFEFALPLSEVSVARNERVAFQLSIWRDGRPLDAIPQQGWIEFSTADPSGQA